MKPGELFQAVNKSLFNAAQPVVGHAENAAAIGTGYLASIPAGLAGIAQGLRPDSTKQKGMYFNGKWVPSVMGDEVRPAADVVRSVQDSLTYQPRTLAAQREMQAVGNAVQPVVESPPAQWLAQKYYDASASNPLLTTMLLAAAEFVPGGKEGKQVLRLKHYSKVPDLKEVDPAFFGTAGAGAERKRKQASPENWVDRSYFGDENYKRESMLGSHEYETEIDMSEVYDFDKDPLDLWGRTADMPQYARTNEMERLIKEEGFRAYYSPSQGVAAVFDKQPVWKPGEKPQAKPKTEKPKTEKQLRAEEAKRHKAFALDPVRHEEGAAQAAQYAPERVAQYQAGVEGGGPVQINVGLNIGDTADIINPQDVTDALRAMGVKINKADKQLSSSEWTYTANLDRPLTIEEGEKLAAMFQQQGIPMAVGDKGFMFGPEAASWGDFDPKQFMYTRTPNRAKPGQTVQKPYRVYAPGIYKPVDELIGDARKQFIPEDPDLQRLWGVTREDLYNQSLVPGNQQHVIPGAVDKPGVVDSTVGVMNPRNKQRLMDSVEALREKDPEMYKAFHAWYMMNPAFDRLVELVGPDEALKRFMKLNWGSALESPNMAVPGELTRGTAAYHMDEIGKFDEWAAQGGLPVTKRDIPEIATVPGRIGGKEIAKRQRQVFDEIERNGGQLTPEIHDIMAHKTGLYAHESSVPQIGRQDSMEVGDAHAVRNMGLADTRWSNKDPGKSISRAELQALEPWLEDIAKRTGVRPGPAQAIRWNLFGPQTGVKTPIGPGKLEILTKKIRETANRKGISLEEARDRVLLGKEYAGFIDWDLLKIMAIAGGAGALAYGGIDYAERTAGKKAAKLKRKSKNLLEEVGE